MLLMMFIVCCCLILSFETIKHSLPQKNARRKELQNLFTTFAFANRDLTISASHIERFFSETSNTSTYAASSDILDMRRSLHYNAQLLLHYTNQVNDPTQTHENRAVFVALRKERISWFSDVLTKIELLFEPEINLNPSSKEVAEEILRLAGRAFRV